MMRESRQELAFLAVKEDKIDIGTVIEFSATEFAQSKDGKIGRRRPGRFPQFRIPVGEDFTHANFSELG